MRELSLSGRHGRAGAYALVDDGWYEILRTFRWYLGTRADCVATSIHIGSRSHGTYMTLRFALHRVVMTLIENRQLDSSEYVDHKNQDILDNCEENLRIVTHSQNQQNAGRRLRIKNPGLKPSRYKGLIWNERSQRWKVVVTLDGKQYYAGSHKNEMRAARIYDKKALELHGEYARLNFPTERHFSMAQTMETV